VICIIVVWNLRVLSAQNYCNIILFHIVPALHYIYNTTQRSGKQTKTLSAYPKDSLKLAHHASHSTHLPSVTTSGTSTTDSVAPTMFKHKTRSNADLSALMGGSVSSSVNDDNIVVDTTMAATTALPFKSNRNKPTTTNNTTNITTTNTNTNTANHANFNTTSTTTNTSTNANNTSTSSGSYANGTAGTAGAPKGFVNMGSNGVLGEKC